MPFIINACLLIHTTMSYAQTTSPKINRKPVVAGQFYPATKAEIEKQLAGFFAAATPERKSDLRAIIAPHAGYVYSGAVAAQAFNQIDPNTEYENIFIIASSHRASFAGASIYNLGDYITPMGEVEVNTGLASKLIAENKVFSYKYEAHNAEHSIEVQLPFLQYHLKKAFRIVPIVIGTGDTATVRQISEALKPWFNAKNLFVISTDFSHYPKYNEAVSADSLTADGICSNNPKEFLSVLDANDAKRISGLATSACGWASVLALMYLSEGKDFQYSKIAYQNSGDVKIGDKSRVVGYWAIVVNEKLKMKSEEFGLSEKEKAQLLKLARETIQEYLKTGKTLVVDSATYSTALHAEAGAFVTLHKNGNLRGCIGLFSAKEPLYKVVQQMAIASATKDSRFDRVKPEELDSIDLEISVLSPMKKIQSADEIELGKHGIYIKKGFSAGTFLPQVATETGWSLDEFLGHCSRDKAGIGWDGWKSADVFVYTALVFGEKE
ncbi:MAG: AmmeMemoRadiSam system protein B [Bacteroidetes bacterium]|nr:AmmeMemoRadiSam system protein B [Bacteroidota bacterium]MBU1717507.1 AmmeMemoRadiSam system protein B [Bacteroidota bacterium]